MKKFLALLLVLCLFITSCGKTDVVETADEEVSVNENNIFISDNSISENTVVEEERLCDKIEYALLILGDTGVTVQVPADVGEFYVKCGNFCEADGSPYLYMGSPIDEFYDITLYIEEVVTQDGLNRFNDINENVDISTTCESDTSIVHYEGAYGLSVDGVPIIASCSIRVDDSIQFDDTVVQYMLESINCEYLNVDTFGLEGNFSV